MLNFVAQQSIPTAEVSRVVSSHFLAPRQEFISQASVVPSLVLETYSVTALALE